jgi:hypothetical protein
MPNKIFDTDIERMSHTFHFHIRIKEQSILKKQREKESLFPKNLRI